MEVRARAPGKIILSGEHAVVHGSAAVAAAIDLYTQSSLHLLPAGPLLLILLHQTIPIHHSFRSFLYLHFLLVELFAGEGDGAGADVVEVDLRDSSLAFSWPCSRLREALGEGCCKAELQAPRPCSSDELAAIAKLLELHEIPEAKIWLSVSLSAFLFLYTSIVGLAGSFLPNNLVMLKLPNSKAQCNCLCPCVGVGLGRSW